MEEGAFDKRGGIEKEFEFTDSMPLEKPFIQIRTLYGRMYLDYNLHWRR
jgi:hypothetical protein